MSEIVDSKEKVRHNLSRIKSFSSYWAPLYPIKKDVQWFASDSVKLCLICHWSCLCFYRHAWRQPATFSWSPRQYRICWDLTVRYLCTLAYLCEHAMQRLWVQILLLSNEKVAEHNATIVLFPRKNLEGQSLVCATLETEVLCIFALCQSLRWDPLIFSSLSVSVSILRRSFLKKGDWFTVLCHKLLHRHFLGRSTTWKRCWGLVDEYVTIPGVSPGNMFLS